MCVSMIIVSIIACHIIFAREAVPRPPLAPRSGLLRAPVPRGHGALRPDGVRPAAAAAPERSLRQRARARQDLFGHLTISPIYYDLKIIVHYFECIVKKLISIRNYVVMFVT